MGVLKFLGCDETGEDGAGDTCRTLIKHARRGTMTDTVCE